MAIQFEKANRRLQKDSKDRMRMCLDVTVAASQRQLSLVVAIESTVERVPSVDFWSRSVCVRSRKILSSNQSDRIGWR